MNLKKEWHPGTLKNQEEVWKVEQKAKEEEQKLEQLKKELEEERQMQELQRLQEKSGRRKRSDRLDWMYNGGPAPQNDITQDKEDFLLGRKSVLSLISGEQPVVLSNGLTIDKLYNHERETQKKIREDPMFDIKLQEKQMITRLLSNPAAMRKLTERLNTGKTTKIPSVVNSPLIIHSEEKGLKGATHPNKRSDNIRSKRSHEYDIGESGRHKSRRHEKEYNNGRNHERENHRRERSRERRRHSPRKERSQGLSKTTKEERESKLKQMMEDAEIMEKERKNKVKKYIEQEKRQEEKNKQELEKNSRNGLGNVEFIKKTTNKIYSEMDLGSRIKRNKNKLVNE